MFRCYLAGYISSKCLDKCVAWRKQIIAHYEDRYLIVWLDPMNYRNLEHTHENGNKSDVSGKAFMLRDYHGVKSANLIIVNLDTFGEERPLIGSIYELAWAWQDHKPVVAIGTDRHYIKHPFIRDTIVEIFSTVEELLASDIIEYYLKGTISASS